MTYQPHQAEDATLKPVSRGPHTRAARFDAVRFHAALMKAARDLKVPQLKDIAAEIGVSQNTIGRMQRGRPPAVDTALALCHWAGLNPLDYLELPQST